LPKRFSKKVEAIAVLLTIGVLFIGNCQFIDDSQFFIALAREFLRATISRADCAGGEIACYVARLQRAFFRGKKANSDKKVTRAKERDLRSLNPY